MKLECKNAKQKNLPDFDHKLLMTALMSIKYGGQKMLEVRTKDEKSCLKICKSDLFQGAFINHEAWPGKNDRKRSKNGQNGHDMINNYQHLKIFVCMVYECSSKMDAQMETNVMLQ